MVKKYAKISAFLLVLVMSVFLFSSFASATVDLTDGLVSYWNLDEISGTLAVDSLGLHNGTANNARVFTSEVSGVINTGADFTQGNDRINTNYASGFTATSEFTLGSWVYIPSGKNNKRHIVLSNYVSKGAGSAALEIFSDNKVRIHFAGSSAGTHDYRSDYTLNTDTLYLLIITYSNQDIKIYINAVEQTVTKSSDTTISGHMSAGHYFIGDDNRGGTKIYSDLYIDEVGIWDRALSSTEIEYLYEIQKDGKQSGQYPFIFTLTAKDISTGNLIEDFNVSLVSNETITYANINGSITTNISSADNRLWNITFSSTDYQDLVFNNYNISQSGNLEALMFTGTIEFKAFSKIKNEELNNFSINIQSNGFNETILNNESISISTGTYNFTFIKTGWHSKTVLFNYAGEELFNFTVFDAKINLSAYDPINNLVVSGFNISVNNSEYAFIESGSTSTNTFSFNLLQGLNYTFTAEKLGYVTKTFNLLINESNQNYNITLFSDASLFIQFRDEITLSPKLNVTFDILSDVFSGRFNTLTGNITLSNLPYGDYEIRYSLLDSDYRERSYYYRLPITDSAQASITLFVLQDELSSLFVRRFVDQAARPLENSYVEIQRAYVSTDNTSIIYRTVEIAQVNSQGNIVFAAVPNTQAYRFRVLDDFNLIRTFPSTFLITPTEEIRVDTDVSVIDNFKKYRGITSILTFNAETNFTILDYSDAASEVEEICLNIERRYRNIVNRTRQCENSVSGTIALAAPTSEPGVLYAYATAKIGDDIFTLNADFINQQQGVSADFRYLGPMLYVLLIVIAGTISFANPVFGLGVAFAGTAALGVGFAGLFIYSQLALGGLLFVAMILLYLVYRQ